MKFVIDDVFFIKSRGLIACCKHHDQMVKPGTPAEVVKSDGTRLPTVIWGFELFRDIIRPKSPNAGMHLKGLAKEDVQRGDEIHIILPEETQ